MNVPGLFRDHPLFSVVLLGVIIRLLVAPLLTHPDDVASWAVIVEGMRAGEGLYASPGYDYPPVWGYVLSHLTTALDWVGVGTLAGRPEDALILVDVGYRGTVPTVSFAFAVKVLLTVVDVVVGLVLHRIVLDLTGDGRKALTACALWMLLPPAILVTAAGGMFDNLCVMFLLLSMFFLIRNNPVLAGVMLALTFTSKIFAAFAVFAMVFYILYTVEGKGDRVRSIILFLGTFAVATLVILTPQILEGTVDDAFHVLTYRLTANGSSDGITARGMALLAMLGAATLVLLAVTWAVFRRSEDKARAMLFTSFFAVGAIVVVSDNLQQYVIEVLPLVVLLYVCYEERLKWPLVLICVMYLVRFLNEVPGMLFSLAEYTSCLSVEALDGVFSWQINEFHDVYWQLKTNGKWLSNLALLSVVMFVLAEFNRSLRRIVEKVF